MELELGLLASWFAGILFTLFTQKHWLPPSLRRHKCTRFIQLPARPAVMCVDCLKKTPLGTKK